jgi:transposase
MERNQTTASGGTTQAQGWTSAQRRKGVSRGYSLRPAYGLRLERYPGGTRAERPDLLAAVSGLDRHRRLGSIVAQHPAASGKRRPDRPVPGDCRQRFLSRGFWGAHTGPNPTDRAKNGCKRHLIVDANGLPLALRVTPANIPDGQLAIPLLDAIPAVTGLQGRPRFRPAIFQGDRAYGWDNNIRATLARGVTPQLARPQDQAHGSGLGRFRVVVEHALAWFNNWRRLRLCYEKKGAHAQGFHDFAASLICFRRWQASL